jgi:endogenous inhibitor of DNA gyrase (YacG/DUF329 family)
MKDLNKKEIKCSICKKYFDQNLKTKPFCSQRCSHVDLGNWLGEKYTISVNEDDFDNDFNIDK